MSTPTLSALDARRLVAISPGQHVIPPRAALVHAWAVARDAWGPHRMHRLAATAPLCPVAIRATDPVPPSTDPPAAAARPGGSVGGDLAASAATRPDLPRQPGVAAYLAARILPRARHHAPTADDCA